MPPNPVPGVRGATLHAGDRLRGEWTVAVVGTHFAGALVSRDLGDSGPDMQRRFDFTITHDRELVLTAARALLRRITPLHA
jgi:DICT domain-containing protein